MQCQKCNTLRKLYVCMLKAMIKHATQRHTCKFDCLQLQCKVLINNLSVHCSVGYKNMLRCSALCHQDDRLTTQHQASNWAILLADTLKKAQWVQQHVSCRVSWWTCAACLLIMHVLLVIHTCMLVKVADTHAGCQWVWSSRRHCGIFTPGG